MKKNNDLGVDLIDLILFALLIVIMTSGIWLIFLMTHINNTFQYADIFQIEPTQWQWRVK